LNWPSGWPMRRRDLTNFSRRGGCWICPN